MILLGVLVEFNGRVFLALMDWSPRVAKLYSRGSGHGWMLDRYLDLRLAKLKRRPMR